MNHDNTHVKQQWTSRYGEASCHFFCQPVDAAEFMTAGEMRNEQYVYLIQISGDLGRLI